MKDDGKSQGWTDFFNYTLAPLFLMIGSTNFSVCVVYLVVVEKSDAGAVTRRGGPVDFVLRAWKSSLVFDPEIVALLAAYTLWSASALLILGGEAYYGPPTSTGHRPRYLRSGFKYYLASLASAALLLSSVSARHWYQKFHVVIGNVVVFGYCVTVLIYLKGRLYRSPGEHGSSGNVVFDFYWGLELYPRLGQWFDVKQWTNCRFGMMAMQLIILLCWKAQVEETGWNWAMATTSCLQTVYLAKFYWWEDGYMNTIDITRDRAGFYICWGCLCFVPSFYTLTNLYMVENSPALRPEIAVVIFVAGTVSILLNYWTDYQKQLVKSTKGKCIIWKVPATVIRGSYRDAENVTREVVLLASGFWGLARHMNYFFEILLHIFWELPSLFSSLIPYLHGLFLTVLLIHRVFRDEKLCQKKYGSYWQQYCQLCKYRIIPGIF
ncbi:7-dehydrocholesterol reductase-like [Centruroides sculpturatus]|uniref:7-dehydrocholesterol reductase-like n=1 Tax=Centruroides sculpturatus TaxID=218467 RepID=UPI000C6CF57E|nr:7-dehydrocholesterol reductase-like [Centruroides sculpturatus]